MKEVQLEPSCFMRTDRRTDITNLIVTFRNFAEAPNNSYIPYLIWFAYLK
jgi:hypothetical protein